MRTWYGAPAYFLLGAVHAIVFWLTVRSSPRSSLLIGFFKSGGGLSARHPGRHRDHQNQASAQVLRGSAGPGARNRGFDGMSGAGAPMAAG